MNNFNRFYILII